MPLYYLLQLVLAPTLLFNLLGLLLGAHLLHLGDVRSSSVFQVQYLSCDSPNPDLRVLAESQPDVASEFHTDEESEPSH
jgi:hypothetical protein